MAPVVSFGRAQLDACNIAQAQPVLGNDEIAYVIDRREFPARPDAEPLVAGRQSPCADGKIAARQEIAKVGHVYAVRRDHVGIEEDANFARIDALQIDAGDAVDALEPAFEQAIEQVVTVGQVAFAGDAQLEHGLVAQRAR